MAQRLVVIGIIILAVIIAAVAFNQQQQAVQQANTAATLQAEAEAEQAEAEAGQGTAVAQAESAEAARAEAETARDTAVAQVNTAETAQAQAEASREAAVGTAQAALMALEQAEITQEAAVGTAQAALTAQAQAEAGQAAAVGTAQAALAAEATAEAALATQVAERELVEFALTAAVDDRVIALNQYREAATVQAGLEATLTSVFVAGVPSAVPTEMATTEAAAPTATLAAAPSPATALDLTETFTTQDGAISLDYPRGWLVQEIQNRIVLVNRASVLQSPTFAPGDFFGTILVIRANNQDDQAPTSETIIRSVMMAISENRTDVQMGEPGDVRLGDQDAKRVEYSSDGEQGVVLVLDQGDNVFIIAWGNWSPGEISQHEPTLRAIVESMRLGGQ